MLDVEPLSMLTQFVWGCFGGAILFTASFAVPELRAAARANDLCWPGPAKICAIALLAACLIALGGAGALLLGDATTTSQAIAYGLASEGLIAGVVQSATLPPSASRNETAMPEEDHDAGRSPDAKDGDRARLGRDGADTADRTAARARSDL
jgi:hypothetical protein